MMLDPELMGSEIAALRKLMGLTKQEMAHGLGVTVLTLSRWESSDKSPVGVVGEVLRGIQSAVHDKPEAARQIGRKMALGIGSLIFFGLCEMAGIKPTAPIVSP